MLSITDKNLLNTISDFSSIPVGASYNIRKNGAGIERSTNEKVQITNKTDKHETESEFPPTSVSTEKLQRRDNVDILKETKQKGE